MVEGIKRCPECRASLNSVYKDRLATFECPQAHGVGINILEAYSHLQRDELEAIWLGVKEAPLSELMSPITGKPMSRVTFLADEDTEFGNNGSRAQKITIEVDVDNYFGWFSFEELRAMPLNATKRGPAGPGFVGLDELDRGEGRHADFFNNLKPQDYEDENWRNTAESSLGGFLGGMARRLRN